MEEEPVIEESFSICDRVWEWPYNSMLILDLELVLLLLTNQVPPLTSNIFFKKYIYLCLEFTLCFKFIKKTCLRSDFVKRNDVP